MISVKTVSPAVLRNNSSVICSVLDSGGSRRLVSGAIRVINKNLARHQLDSFLSLSLITTCNTDYTLLVIVHGSNGSTDMGTMITGDNI